MISEMRDRTYLSTGEAARRCSVTPDTVLKWIKQGRLPARRTPGGHYRIHREDLDPLHGARVAAIQGPDDSSAHRPFQYCWEFNSREGATAPECEQCVVYRTRALRCYEMLRLAPEVGHQKLFCKRSCDECEYYQLVQQQTINVLVVSDNEVVAASLARDADRLPVNLHVTECEYTCSSLVESFRPDYAVIDCSIGAERSRDFVRHLKEDPRLPFVRIVLAAGKGAFPNDCDKEVFACIETPFDAKDILDCINGVRESPIDAQESKQAARSSRK
jgi:excisionase family DNA binding protein